MSPTTKISAIKITKSEPSREAELLRGVHDPQTIYTLTLRNNLINPTKATTIDDWLPAGLEFLSCEGTDDHTTDAPTNPGSTDEYPGSGAIDVAAVTECHEPALVETVKTDPDGAGPLPDAIYTHVLWNTGDLTAGQTLTYRYRAAVPLAENTLDFNGASAGDGTAPDPASNEQAVNLDNNNGPETTDEQALTNYALAQGDYQGTRGGVQEVSSDHSITRTAEDLLVWKDGSSSVLEQGADTSWKLTFKTGEYRYSNDITVTDTLPSGLCPLGPVNYTTGNDADPYERQRHVLHQLPDQDPQEVPEQLPPDDTDRRQRRCLQQGRPHRQRLLALRLTGHPGLRHFRPGHLEQRRPARGRRRRLFSRPGRSVGLPPQGSRAQRYRLSGCDLRQHDPYLQPG